MRAAMQILSTFDSGNIEVVDADNHENIRLKIRLDAGGEHMQWFHFQLAGARGKACRMTIENAGKVSYPDGFRDTAPWPAPIASTGFACRPALTDNSWSSSTRPTAISSTTPISRLTPSMNMNS